MRRFYWIIGVCLLSACASPPKTTQPVASHYQQAHYHQSYQRPSYQRQQRVAPRRTLRRMRPISPQRRVKQRYIIIDLSEQRLYFYYGRRLVRSFTVSTSKYGAGNRAGSGRTPLGRHAIAHKIGYEAKPWTIFKKGLNTRRQANAHSGAAMTSRLLRLEGLQWGRNSGAG